MIAILHKDGIVHLFVPNLVSIEGQNVIGLDAAAKGTTADVLVVDGFTHNQDEMGQFITSGTVTLRQFNPINPADFTDTRAQLLQTNEQFDQQRIADLELVIADAYERGIL